MGILNSIGPICARLHNDRPPLFFVMKEMASDDDASPTMVRLTAVSVNKIVVGGECEAVFKIHQRLRNLPEKPMEADTVAWCATVAKKTRRGVARQVLRDGRYDYFMYGVDGTIADRPCQVFDNDGQVCAIAFNPNFDIMGFKVKRGIV